MKLKFLLIFLLISGFAFSQTTVTLQDQCNCEVLSGTDVSAPGAVTPAGADAGDIYVNTNTGTIYYWDGDSWELTSSDDQQLQNFTFDGPTNTLSLDIEDGNTVTVDLSALNNAGTDDQIAAEVPYDNTTSGLTAGDVQAAIDEINTAAGTVSLVDNGDGTYDFTDAGGAVTTITDTSISTMVDNLDGTYTYTDETGAAQVIDTNASSNPYDNTTSGLTATDVQAAIDEINTAAGTVALVDNGDGTYDFTDAGGAVTTITDTSISTMVDNLDGTYTYTDETGAAQVIATNASSNPYDNTTSGLTATDVQAAIDEINTAAGTVALVDNGDGTYDFTDAGGAVTTITDTSISTMVDNLDGTYTYTDETGAAQVIDTNASSNPYDNTTSGLTATDVQAAIDEINTAAGTVALVDNGDGTYDFTDAGGAVTTITDTSISTMVDNLDGTYTYTDETGAAQVIDTNASSNPYDNTTSGLTATDVQAAIDEINTAAGTVALVDNGDGTYDFTDAGGAVTTITDTSISTMVDNLDGTYTYTDETGAAQVIDTNASSNPYDNTTSGLTATDVQAAIDEINTAAGTVALVDNGDGTYDFTDAGGAVTTITDTSISTMVDNLDGTYTYTDETGAAQVIDTNASSNPYDNTTSGLTATDVQAAIDEINTAAGTVALVDNGDGTYDFTDAGGAVTTITDTSISTMVDNLDGTYTYTDETGAAQVIDTNASSNPYDNTTSGLVATDVQAAIDEINTAAGTVALVDNGDGTYDFTDAGGAVTTITDTSISTMVDNLDGTYTYTDETGAAQVIDTNASSNPYDNTTSGLTATDVQAAIDEINAAAGTVALVDNLDGTYTFTDAAGNNTTISDTSISTLVDNGDATFTYTDETGTPITINLISADLDNDIIVGTDGGVYLDVSSVVIGETITNIVDNADGTFTYTNEDGTPQTINKSDVTDNGDGTYTFTNNDGSDVTINTNANTNPYDNTTSGLTATDVQAAIDEINAAAGTVALVDNLDGTYTFTDASGTNTTISDTSISTMADNGDGTYTYTDETGATQVIDTNASSNPYDNTTSGLTATDVQAAIDEINAAAGTVALVDNLDGTYTFTDASGTNTTISDTSISTMADNGDGTYTYTDETGATQTIETNASSNPYDNTTSGLTATDVQAAIDEVAAGSTDDQNISGSGLAGTDLTIGIENGTNEVVDLSSLVETVIAGTGAITVTDDGFGNYTVNSTDPDEDLTNELSLLGNGAPVVVPSNAGVTYVDTVAGQLYVWDGAAWNAVGGSAAPDLDGDPTNEHNTAFAVNAGNLEITDSGGTLSVPVASLGTDDQNISGSGLAGTDLTIGIENGTNEVVDLSSLVGTDDQTAAEVTYDNLISGLTAIDVQAAIDELATLTDDDMSVTNTVAGNRIATLSEPGIAAVDINETVTNLSDNNDGTFVYTNENGLNQPVAKADLTDNADGTYEFVNNDGTPETIDTRANSNPYDNTTSGLTATDVQAALDEISTGSTDDQNISGSGLAGTTLTIGIEDGTNETVDLSSLVETVVAGTGAITVTDDGFGNYTVNSTDPDEDLTNELTLLGNGAPVVVPSNAGVTYVDTVAGQLFVWDGAAWNAVGGSAAPDLDGDPTNEHNTAFAVNAGNLEITDSGGTLSVPVASLGTDDQNISGSGLAGTDLTIGIENGTNEVVDLSSLVGTDDQTAAEVTYDNLISGLTAIDVQAAIDELATLTDDDMSVSNTVAGNRIATLSEPGIAAVDINETVTNLSDNNDGTFEYTNENGLSQPVAKADLTDNADGTYEFVNNDGTPETIDTRANSNPYDNTTSGLTATDVQAALDEISTGSTDDQNISGSGLAGTNLTIGIENGTNEVVDLSSLVGTDDQNIQALAVDVGTNILTVGIEDGTSQTVDLSHLDDAGTDDQIASEVNITDAGGNFTATEVEGALAELAAGSTDDQNISGSGLAGTDLTIGIENGTNEVVDLSSLVGTDDQTAAEVTYDNLISGLTAIDVQAAIDELATLTDDDMSVTNTVAGNRIATLSEPGIAAVDINETVTNLSDNNDGTFEYTNENGLSQPVAKADLTDNADGTYEFVNNDGTPETIDTRANSNPYDNTTSGLTATDVQAALDEISTGSTDDQNISGSGLAGTNLTIGIENGTNEVVDLSSLVDDADAVIGNEYNTGVAMNAGSLEITDGGGTLSDNLISVDANNDISVGSDGALYLNVASVTISETITNIVDNADGTFTYTNENGVNQTISKADVTDNADGTYTFTNNDGSDVTLDTRAASNPYDNTTSGLTATDVKAALDELAAGSTDDQNISGSGLAGTDLTIGIENGTNEVVDLSSLVGTDDQNIQALAVDVGTNILTVGIEDGTSQTVDLSHLDDAGTDDQNIQALAVDVGTNILTVGIEDGTSQTVDLSHLDDAGTDDQIASEVNITDAGGNFTATEVEGALAELAAGSTDDQTISLAANTLSIEDGNSVNLAGYLDNTDDQNISGSGLAGTDLTIGIENGTNEVVDLSSLVGTDDQNIQALAVDVGTNILTVGIEDGTSQTVDLSHLDDAGTDDQIASEVNITDAGGNFTATEVEGALAELAAGSTDDQTISLAANTLSIEDGNSVDLSGYLDNTDDQNISGSGLAGTDLTIGIENGTNEVVDLSSLVGTDDQNIQALAVDVGTNILTVGIEDGTSQTVDLSHLDDAGTDDQNIQALAVDVGTNILTVGIEDGTSQTVDLSHLDDAGTDDQNIQALAVDVGTNILTVGIEDGTSQTVDLSHLDDAGTDDQIASEVNITDAGGNFTATEVEGALAELAAGSTDDQTISLAANTLSIEDGNSVNLAGYLDNTDNQDLSLAGNTLSLTNDATPVDLSGYLDNTDNQNISGSGLAGTTLTIGIQNGTNETVDLSSLVGTDNQDLSLAGNTLSLTNDATPVDLSGYLDNTDDQNISGSGLAGTTLTIGIENGTNETVDLSTLVGTDDQNIQSLGVDVVTNILTVGIEDGTSQTVDLSHLDNAGTDDQTISLAANTLSIEDGNSVDLSSYLDNTDDQNISGSGLAGTTLTIGIENGTNETVDLSSLVGTDDQNIQSLGVDVVTNILTVGIEDGTSQTVDLSHLDDAGTDDQTASEVSITDAGGNFTSTDVEGALAELAGQTDDDVSVTNTIAGNRIATISEPGIAAVDIDETVTDLTQNTTTGVITYTQEDATTQTADVISTDADNLIEVGTDGGAFLNVPLTYALGKVNGNGTAAAIHGATVSRINEGDYQVTFSTALSNANYIIQLSTLDCNGDCPGNTSANFDDPGITYYDQQTTGFKVNIGDSDNGGVAKDDIDLEFMFTVTTIPN